MSQEEYDKATMGKVKMSSIFVFQYRLSPGVEVKYEEFYKILGKE